MLLESFDKALQDNILIFSGILWLVFAIFCYIFIVYSVGFIMFWRIKANHKFYDKKALVIEKILAFLNFSGQVGTVILYIFLGKFVNTTLDSTTQATLTSNIELFPDSSSIYIIYGLFLGFNLLFILLYLVFFFMFSNNLAIKFDSEKMYLIGISIWNTSFVDFYRSSKGNLVLKYVYKSDENKNWSEKLRFFSFFKSTKFLEDNYNKFFDVQKNLAFYNLSKKTDNTSPKTNPSVAKKTPSAKK